jgi:hypothetical protein
MPVFQNIVNKYVRDKKGIHLIVQGLLKLLHSAV